MCKSVATLAYLAKIDCSVMKLYVKLIKLKVVQCRLVTVSVYQFKIPRFCDKGISNWIYSRVGIHVLAYFQLVYEHGLRALAPSVDS